MWVSVVVMWVLVDVAMTVVLPEVVEVEQSAQQDVVVSVVAVVVVVVVVQVAVFAVLHKSGGMQGIVAFDEGRAGDPYVLVGSQVEGLHFSLFPKELRRI
jgi:hypothetical protein